MATQSQITRHAPYLEAAGEVLTDEFMHQAGLPLKTELYAPQVAGQSLLAQQAQQMGATGAGLGTLQRDATGRITGFTGGTGISAYEPYLQAAAPYGDPSAATLEGLMSPYQQNVLDTTLAEINRSYDQQGIQQAAKAGQQFGGSRYGVQSAEMQRNRADAIAQQTAKINQDAFLNAQQQAQNIFQNQMGLAQQVPGFQQQQMAGLAGLGQEELGYQQSIIDASAQAAKTQAYEPYERLGFFGEQLTGLMGGMPTSTRMLPQLPATPLSTAIGVGGGLASLGAGMTRGSVYG